MKFRHLGIKVDSIAKAKLFYHKMGFEDRAQGHCIINGEVIPWLKMYDTQGFCIELIENAEMHIAVTVDHVDESIYYFTAPSGHKIQFFRAPGGMLIEAVEEPNKTKDHEV
jgi:catechol 2,3-dioxygenase-like lactoylglutathione lyase family enzyme